MRWSILLCLVISVVFTSVNTVKILTVISTPSKSHWMLAQNLMQELVKSGHEVTVISPYPLKNPPENYRDIPTVEAIQEFKVAMQDGLFDEMNWSIFQLFEETIRFCHGVANFTIKHPNVDKLLKSNETFDLIFVEAFLNDVFLGLGHFYDAPIISMSPMGATPWISNLVGNPMPYSYVPYIMSHLTDRMGFLDRFWNAVLNLVEDYYIRTLYMELESELYEEVFPDPKPSFEYVRKHAVSLGLLNNHFSLSYSQPYLPNMIEVGGMHLNLKPKPLPEDLKTFIESAEHGVVYFSMGSNLKPSQIPEDKLGSIYGALSKLKQKVILKWDQLEFFEKNEQFLVRNWLPQDDLLTHPNIRLFITHGGLLSCTEAAFHGIPVIGIPVFADQLLNMAKIETAGWGLAVQYKNVTEESLSWALSEILSNPKYTETAMLASRRFRDRPQPPLQVAKYWVEYVIRHKGAPHMRSAVQNLSFIEYHMIDVLAVTILVFMILYAAMVLICRWSLNKIYGKTLSDNSKNIKKNS